ncbi:MAG: MFS transporter [Alphaproteobacteria bacterium]|nr:MFS transporter [Alphaproteobacteria bacterium]
METSFTRRETVHVIAGLMLAVFLAGLDQTIVATSLSTMARDLDGWRLMPWVVSAYLVSSTTTTPIYGRLSDLYGRRPVMLVSLGLFVGASVLCALSQTMPQLIAARVVQGLGGGGLRAVAQAVMADIIPPRERGRYQGYFASMFAISSIVGPALGGFFAEYLSWHWIFWINVPLGFAALVLSNRNLKRLPVPTRKPTIDWAGAGLILVSVTPLLIGVSRVEAAGTWLAIDVLGPIAAGVVFGIALVMRERVAPEPMIPLRLFANWTFAVTSVIAFLMYMLMMAMTILIAIAYQLAAGLSANAAALRVLPLTAGTVLGSFIAGQIVTRTGRYRIFPILGAASGAVLFAAVALVGLGRSLAFDVAATGLIGIGFGFQLSPVMVSVQNALERRDTGIGMSCIIFFRLMGGALGVALFSSVLVGAFNGGVTIVPGFEVLGDNPGLALFHLDEHRQHLTPALLGGLAGVVDDAFRRVFLVAALISALAALGATLLTETPLRGRDTTDGPPGR